FLDGGLAGAGGVHGGRQQAGVLTGASDRLGDVGGDVPQRRPAGEVFRHSAFGVGDLHLGFNDPADRVAALAFGQALFEGVVEVGAHDPLRVGSRERVAGAAFCDEL